MMRPALSVQWLDAGLTVEQALDGSSLRRTAA